VRVRRAPGDGRGVITVAATATRPQCLRADCGEELIFSYYVGNKGRLYPIYWCVADGNHYVRIHGELVPLIPVVSGRRRASMERTREG